MNGEFNVLITSAGRRVALVELFRRTLKELGLAGRVIAADMSRASAAFHAADRGVLLPPLSDEGYADALLALCSEEPVGLVVPTIDPELDPLACIRDDLAAAGTTAAISGQETIAIGSDKKRTNAWLHDNGFPTVRQGTPAEVLADPAGWPLPLIVKPRAGSASVGVARVTSTDELRAAASGSDMVVETIAPGFEITIDALVDGSGRTVCAVPRRRIEVRSGESSKGVTMRHAPAQALTERICALLPQAYGPITIQLFLEPATEELSVIEINPRFGGGYPLSWHAGAHYPRWMIEELAGLPSTASADAWRDGVVMLRYDDAVFVEQVDLR